MRERAPDRGGARAQHDEDDREAQRERKARHHDPLGDAALLQPHGLDPRDCREVAWHERQHARKCDRDDSGQERERNALSHPAPGAGAAGASAL